MSVGHLYDLFGEVSVQVFCSLLNWIACLPGVEIKPSSDGSLANMFSVTVGSEPF